MQISLPRAVRASGMTQDYDGDNEKDEDDECNDDDDDQFWSFSKYAVQVPPSCGLPPELLEIYWEHMKVLTKSSYSLLSFT